MYIIKKIYHIKAYVLLIMMLTIVSTAVYSQDMDKKTAKKYKKELKKMSVEQYSTLKDNIKRKKENIEKLKQEINTLESTEAKETKKLSSLKDELQVAREQIAFIRKEIASLTNPPSQEEKLLTTPQNTGGKSTSKWKKGNVNGIIFRVQIGAFKNKDLTKFFEKNEEFLSSGNTYVDINSYTVGSFSDYWEADAFKKLIRKMGAKDVRVLVYKDGVKTSMKEVLEQLRGTN